MASIGELITPGKKKWKGGGVFSHPICRAIRLLYRHLHAANSVCVRSMYSNLQTSLIIHRLLRGTTCCDTWDTRGQPGGVTPDTSLSGAPDPKRLQVHVKYGGTVQLHTQYSQIHYCSSGKKEHSVRLSCKSSGLAVQRFLGMQDSDIWDNAVLD